MKTIFRISMKQISNADFAKAIRLLDALSNMKGESLREREAARKAKLLSRKLKRISQNVKV